MATESKVKTKKPLRPIASKRQPFKQAMTETNKQYAETLARLAK